MTPSLPTPSTAHFRHTRLTFAEALRIVILMLILKTGDWEMQDQNHCDIGCGTPFHCPYIIYCYLKQGPGQGVTFSRPENVPRLTFQLKPVKRHCSHTELCSKKLNVGGRRSVN